MHRYKELHVWRRALKFVKPIYKLAESFPQDEKYCLTQQLKRAVTSISLNISEGAGRRTKKDFSHFLDIAIGSLYEVENCLFIADELDYIKVSENKELFKESEEILRMIIALQNKIKV